MALWAACSRPVPSFRAKVFRHSETAQKQEASQGLKLVAPVQEESGGLKLLVSYAYFLCLPVVPHKAVAEVSQ